MEIHLLIHLYFVLQTGQNEPFSSVFPLPAAVLLHQCAGNSPAAVLRQNTKPQQHNVFSFRIVQADLIEKSIAELCLVCCKSVQCSGDFSSLFVYCRQKQLRRVLHTLTHALFGARLIRRKTGKFNGNALLHLLLADRAKFISFHSVVFLRDPLKELWKTAFYCKLIEWIKPRFFFLPVVIILSCLQIDRQTVEWKTFFALWMRCANQPKRSALHRRFHRIITMSFIENQ